MQQKSVNQFAKRSLGQNFLIDEQIIDKIVSALGDISNDTVVEIGPGRGALSKIILEKNASLFAIEIDRELVPLLREKFAHFNGFSCIEADILDVDLTEVLPTLETRLKLIGNLPYNISTPILQVLSENRHFFSRIILMLQREVVERITAKPGDSSRGYLTVLVEDSFETEYLFDVPPTAFRPVPKVWSSIVALTPKSDLNVEPEHFRRLLSTSFAQKRKTIFNNLRNVYPTAADLLDSVGIDPKRRAETLTLAEWKQLLKVILNENRPQI